MPGRMEVAKREDEEEAHVLSYKSRPHLAKPGTYLRDIKYLINAMDNNEIDVNPEYQREVVWTADRMSQLIDSLMENYYIPPIILNRQTDSGTSNSVLVCVDGKQRLSSVRAFVQGLIPCQDRNSEKWWFRNAQGRGNKNVLSDKEQQEFLNKDFVTFEYTDLRPEQEEDLFARVQMGMPLSAAEKMRAQSGPWQELARCFCRDFPLIYSLQKDRMRAKDFQLTLSCFSQIMEVQYPTPTDGIPMLKTNHNYLPKLLRKTDSVDDDTKSHLASVWKTFQDLIELDPDTFTNVSKRLKGVQTFAPVEMIAVTVLISIHSETRNNRLLIEDIRSLRDTLRENFTDLRTNSYTWKAIWSFVDNLENSREVVDGSTVDRNVQPVATPPRPSLIPAVSSPKKGRPIARTKPPTVLPEAGGTNATAAKPTTEVKLEPEEPELDSLDSRPRKRPRRYLGTDSTIPQASAASPAAQAQPSTLPAQDLMSQGIPLRHTPSVSSLRQEHSTRETTSNCPVSVSEAQRLSPFASLGSPISAPPIPSNTRQRIAPPGAETSASYDPPKQISLEGSANTLPPSNSVPSPTPPVMPSEARQNRKSVLESYRAPVAPMDLGLSLRLIPSTQPQAPVPIARASAREVQVNKSKSAAKQKTLPQFDGAIIDLTDDEPETMEEQRARLLSAFQRDSAAQKS